MFHTDVHCNILNVNVQYGAVILTNFKEMGGSSYIFLKEKKLSDLIRSCSEKG
jgi:hypothetical protein